MYADDLDECPVTDADLAAQLVTLFDALAEYLPSEFPGEVAAFAENLQGVRTLRAGGWMTRDEGVELTFGSGARFLLTVQEARR